MEILQNFLLEPKAEFGSRNKYYRVDGQVSYENGEMLIGTSASVSFDSFYNALSVPLWQKKVGISQLSLQLRGQGKIKIELWQYTKNYVNILIDEKELSLASLNGLQEIFTLDISDTNTFNGLIYPKIIAVEKTTISDVQWLSPEEPKHQVKLGISITHFNRKNYVIPAIKRIKENLLDDKNWQGKIDFIVVDNSQNITAEESQGVQVLPNENTGGSGGFTAGFLHYKNDTDATHVLFMDDDASLEVESIKRTYQILQYASDEKTAVGASLFYEDRPDIFIERGAILSPKTIWQAKYRDGWGITRDSMLFQETSDETDDYAGWWFFAFPIKQAKKLAPPYFVRGDDVSFGMLNDFHIIFTLGISCMAEDFAYKVAPMTEYLDMRNKLIVEALFIKSRYAAWSYYFNLEFRMLLAARYDYVDVLRLALNDFLNVTPKWLSENINMANKIAEIKAITVNDVPGDLDYSKFDITYNPVFIQNKLITILKAFILPRRTDKIVVQNFEITPIYRQMVNFKKVLYYNPETNKGFIVEASRRSLYKGLFHLIGDAFKIVFNYKKVQKRLVDNLGTLTSEEQWEEILNKK